jgi:hypothetical protein
MGATGPETIVWAEGDRAQFLKRVAAASGLRVVGAGCGVKGRSSAAASCFGCEPVDDLRSVLTESPCEAVLIGSAGDFGAASSPSDAGAVLAALQRGVRVLTLDPLPASAMELSGAWSTPGAGGVTPACGVRFVPLARVAKPLRDAAEVLEMFGPARTVFVEACCRPEEGALGSRLFGAVELVLWLMGEPESVDAAYAPPRRGPLIPLPGETLRDTHGDVTLNFRFADGRAAALLASDQSGRWSRSATLLGPEGRLRVFDDGFEWVNAKGDRVDASRQTKRRGETPADRAVQVVSDAVSRILDPAVPEAAPVDHAGVLAVCQAALLSVRTGSGESPATIRRMMQVG